MLHQRRRIRNSIQTERVQSRRDVSAIMRNVHSSDTTPEKIFRRALWAKGFRYRTCQANLPGKPDVVLASKRVAIFIDGDFWHGGQWRQRSLSSLEDQFQKTTSKDYWLKKIRRNMSRDCRATASLISEGWTVLRFWESDIRKNLEVCVDITIDVIDGGTKPDPFSLLPQKTFAEFFAGIGLMRMGLERQDWSVSFANDIDPQKEEMYRENFRDISSHFKCGDIYDIRANDLPSVSLATASFPCNDLSLAGMRQGLTAGKHSSAFWEFVRILGDWGERRPRLILLENVTGFLTSHKGEDFKEALLALNQLGYSVDAFIIDAVQFVPQSRQRLFIIGVLDDHIDRRDGEEFHLIVESELRPRALTNFIISHSDIRWNIRYLPTPQKSNVRLEDLIDDLPESSPEWWSPARAEYLLNQMSVRHRKLADEMIEASEWSYGTVFRRVRNGKSMAELRTDGVAGCLRTPRGGSGRQILFKAGKGKYYARLVTARECARLMGADDYKITVSLNQALFGFGDAVCVPVIEWIAAYYLNPLVNELIHKKPLSMTLQSA